MGALQSGPNPREDEAQNEDGCAMQSTSADGEICPICGECFSNRWRPFIHTPLEQDGKMKTRLCHLYCVRGLLRQLPEDESRPKPVARVSDGFVRDLAFIDAHCSTLSRDEPNIRICFEEMLLHDAAKSGQGLVWPTPEIPVPPDLTWNFVGIREVRISACPALRKLPAAIGCMRGLKTFVFITTGLTELPEEMGQLSELAVIYLNGNFLRTLPASLCKLPQIREICLDSNLVEVLPPIESTKLVLFTAPANRLTELPSMAGRIGRIEVHGNNLHSGEKLLNGRAQWEYIECLKIMGNQLTSLPEEINLMKWLRLASVAGNQLKSLPKGFGEMPRLEWLFAYDNQLDDLPSGLLRGAPKLERLLLERNPLRPSAVDALLSDLRGGVGAYLNTVGLDVDQVRSISEAANTAQQVFPSCVSVGEPLSLGGHGQYWMKLSRASQLRRDKSMATIGQPAGPTCPTADPSSLLVVAFSASQGEPEWLGLARRLAQDPTITAIRGRNLNFNDLMSDTGGAAEECIATLWSSCITSEQKSTAEFESVTVDLPDFDILNVIDHRMRWYAEDVPSFQQALRKISEPYKRVLFVGASMGGFGALLHASEVADAVVAFSPQVDLNTACLRPPGDDCQALQSLSEKVIESVKKATARGVSVYVHTSVDEHMKHAMHLLPSGANLTVHPLVPRKPFARILDRANNLLPIMQEIMCATLLRQDVKEDTQGVDACGESHFVDLAMWRGGGGFDRVRTSASKVLEMCHGSPVNLPRPGDWFCKVCRKRNMCTTFFCYKCSVGTPDATVASDGTPRIPGGSWVPQKGDWGCGGCGQGNWGCNKWCDRCKLPVDGNMHSVIVK